MYCMPCTTEYPAMVAGNMCTSHAHAQRTQSQPTRMSAQATCGMWAAASATVSILLIQTGVVAPVSLFALLISIISLLLVVLSGLLSLSCLTGLVISTVGLVKRLSYLTIRIEDTAIGTKAGD